MMDTRTGRLYDTWEGAIQDGVPAECLMLVENDKLTRAQRRKRRVGPNTLCPCGSGKKFKRCCQWKKFPAIPGSSPGGAAEEDR